MDPNHFPSRLHEMLQEVDRNESDGFAQIVSWQPHGKCFLIKQKEEFIEKVLPIWFCRLKFSTFERQLHKHGFRKLCRKGPDFGAYYHPNFIRENPELASTIKHTNIKGKRGRKPHAKLTEPDFYSSSTLAPEGEPSGTVAGVSRTKQNQAASASGVDAESKKPAASSTAGTMIQQPERINIQESKLSDSSPPIEQGYAQLAAPNRTFTPSYQGGASLLQSSDTLLGGVNPTPSGNQLQWPQMLPHPSALTSTTAASVSAASGSNVAPATALSMSGQPGLQMPPSARRRLSGLGGEGTGTAGITPSSRLFDSEGDSPPTDLAPLASLLFGDQRQSQNFASIQQSSRPEASPQMPTQGYPSLEQTRVSDLLFSGQQHQQQQQQQQQQQMMMNLQLQQLQLDQLEQQRLQLQMIGQQQQDQHPGQAHLSSLQQLNSQSRNTSLLEQQYLNLNQRTLQDQQQQQQQQLLQLQQLQLQQEQLQRQQQRQGRDGQGQGQQQPDQHFQGQPQP